MNKNFTYYFIPTFIVIYFVLAFLPITTSLQSEIFPFFSYKLYSKIPNGFTTYDLLINKGTADEFFLILGNTSLNNYQRKHFNDRIQLLGNQFEESNVISISEYADLLSMGKSIFLIKLSGDYVKAVKDEAFTIDILKQLK